MTRKHLVRPFALKTMVADGRFEGYGSVFDVRDAFAEKVAPGAFARSLAQHRRQGSMPAMLWQHDAGQPIGVWTEIAEDEAGLKVAGQLALSTQRGHEAYELLKLGAINGLSIGYATIASAIDEKSRARVLTDVDLWEVSLVTFPANSAARVLAVKADDITDKRSFEKFLREAGFSRARAVAIANHGFCNAPPREAAALGELARRLRQNAQELELTLKGLQTWNSNT
jgi:HK97 family phage prohead protease